MGRTQILEIRKIERTDQKPAQRTMDEKFRRRHLPHWDMPGATYFITSCLDSSIPAEGLLDIVKHQ